MKFTVKERNGQIQVWQGGKIAHRADSDKAALKWIRTQIHDAEDFIRIMGSQIAFYLKDTLEGDIDKESAADWLDRCHQFIYHHKLLTANAEWRN